jgi:thiol-disulfide isomerase/thioredoxin
MPEREPNSNKKKDRFKTTIYALVGLGLLVLVGAVFALLNQFKPAQFPDETKEVRPFVPQTLDIPAPELTLTDLNNQPVNLSDYLGQVVLVNNWAFWCTPCREELPTLEAYYQDQRTKGFVIVAIESGGRKEDIAYHVDLYKLTFPVWMDPEKISMHTFKNANLPNSYLIDRQGTVRLAWNGPINQTLLNQYVTPIIEE